MGAFLRDAWAGLLVASETGHVVGRPAPTAMAASSVVSAAAAWDDHGRWLYEMKQEYARRRFMALDRSSRSVPSSFEVTGDTPVYRSIDMSGLGGREVGGHEALRPVYRGEQFSSHAEVDEEWKRSLPPMLQRQTAFTH